MAVMIQHLCGRDRGFLACQMVQNRHGMAFTFVNASILCIPDIIGKGRGIRFKRRGLSVKFVLQQNTVNWLTDGVEHNLCVKILGNSSTWANLCVCQTNFMDEASLEISWVKHRGWKIPYITQAMTEMIGAIIIDTKLTYELLRCDNAITLPSTLRKKGENYGSLAFFCSPFL